MDATVPKVHIDPMTATEMAAAANCSSETIRRWIHDGRLPARQHGISRRFTVDRDAFVRFCEANDVPIDLSHVGQ